MAGQAAPAPAGMISRVSWRLLPIIGFSYLVAYVDRSNLSFASVGMNADLGFSQTVYGIGASVFFIGYALFEVPSNLLLDRFGARRWIARIMFSWGLISIGTLFVNAAWNFYLLRFLLGVAEAGFYPGVVHYLSHWLPANERGRAVSRFYVFAPLGNMLMGLLATPILALDGAAGLAGWQWLLLLEGLPALVMAGVVLIALPEAPATAPWLSDAEKNWLSARLAEDAVAGGGHQHRLGRALIDPIVLTMGGAAACVFLTTNAISYSAPKLLMGAHHWSMAAAGGTIALGSLINIFAMLVVGSIADRARNPFAIMALLALMGGGGVLTVALGSGVGLAAPGYLLLWSGLQSAGMLPGIIVSRYVHPAARAGGLAMTNSIAQTGAFFGPLLFGIAADRSGSFTLGLELLVPVTLLAAALCLVGRWAQGRRGRHAALAPAI